MEWSRSDHGWPAVKRRRRSWTPGQWTPRRSSRRLRERPISPRTRRLSLTRGRGSIETRGLKLEGGRPRWQSSRAVWTASSRAVWTASSRASSRRRAPRTTRRRSTGRPRPRTTRPRSTRRPFNSGPSVEAYEHRGRVPRRSLRRTRAESSATSSRRERRARVRAEGGQRDVLAQGRAEDLEDQDQDEFFNQADPKVFSSHEEGFLCFSLRIYIPSFVIIVLVSESF